MVNGGMECCSCQREGVGAEHGRPAAAVEFFVCEQTNGTESSPVPENQGRMFGKSQHHTNVHVGRWWNPQQQPSHSGFDHQSLWLIGHRSRQPKHSPFASPFDRVNSAAN
jgi:hypothetical protein